MRYIRDVETGTGFDGQDRGRSFLFGGIVVFWVINTIR
jgi:hypothetical protein